MGVFASYLGHNADVCLEVPSNSSGRSVLGPGFEPETSRIPKTNAIQIDHESLFADFDM
jgi:hypothetical protein